MTTRRTEWVRSPEPVRYSDGYHLHPIQARLVGADLDHWALVTMAASVDGTLIVEYDDAHLSRLVRYLPGGIAVLPISTVVRLNSRYRVLAHPTAGWLSVRIVSPHPTGSWDVFEGRSVSLPGREMLPRTVAVDVATGTGIPL